MKILALKLILLLPLAFFCQLYSAPDEYVRLTGKVTVTKESETWIKASVPFGIIGHPKAQTYSRSKPTGLADVVNLEFMNNMKVKIYLCFSNEFKKKALRVITVQKFIYLKVVRTMTLWVGLKAL